MEAFKSEEYLNVEVLKRDLEPFKGAVVSAYRVLTWEKPHFPVVLFVAISAFYSMLWYFDPPMITLMSLLALGLVIFEYLLPTISRLLLAHVLWEGDHEAKYESVCVQLYDIKTTWHAWDDFLFEQRRSAIRVILMSLLLLGFAWIGVYVDNLLLMYLATLLAAIWAALQDNPVLKNINQTILSSTPQHQ